MVYLLYLDQRVFLFSVLDIASVSSLHYQGDKETTTFKCQFRPTIVSGRKALQLYIALVSVVAEGRIGNKYITPS